MFLPILMNTIMTYVNGGDKTTEQSILYFCAIFFTSFMTALIIAQLYYHFGIFGYNLTNTLSLMIYNKALKHPLLTEKNYSISDIINYSQVDAQRMGYLGFQLTGILFAPI